MSSAAMAAAMRTACVRSSGSLLLTERLLCGTRRHPCPVRRRNGRRYECRPRRKCYTVLHIRQRRRAHARHLRLPCGVQPRRDDISVVTR
eukprot:5653176-Prymnesium_polylepis.1